jgi:hypothetical protein
MKRDVGLVADNPTVVRHRRYVEQFAGTKLEDSAIVKGGGCCARQHQTNMFQMASSGTHGWPNMLGPFPTRLISGSTDDHFTNPDGFKFSLLELHNFVGLLESL